MPPLTDYKPMSNIGSILSMKAGTESTFAELPGVSATPDLFGDPAEIDVTDIKAGRKRTIPGVEDISALSFEFFFDNRPDSSYRRLIAVENAKQQAEFELSYPDGTKFAWTATVYTKPLGFASGDSLRFVALLYLTSEDITITNPTT